VSGLFTQIELDALVEAATPETWSREQLRRDAQLRLQRLCDDGVLRLDKNWKYELARATKDAKDA
jgi:hypothetical protein